jgi:hypothetical protein
MVYGTVSWSRWRVICGNIWVFFLAGPDDVRRGGQDEEDDEVDVSAEARIEGSFSAHLSGSSLFGTF